MKYQDQLNQHLANYKLSSLGIAEPGSFTYRGQELLYQHILPEGQADLNLFPRVRPIERTVGLRAKRHRYFRHLNSSQAFAFNLFLPFFSGGPAGSSVLLRAFGQEGSVSHWELEAVPEAEEGTNIDARWVCTNGITTLCEVKLSEGEFGKTEADDRHRNKLATMYRPVLASHVDQELLAEPAFFDNYQVLRNVYHLARQSGGALIFLIPRANAKLWAALLKVLDRVAPTIRARISVLAVEDVISALAADELCPPELREHVADLIAKYLLAT